MCPLIRGGRQLLPCNSYWMLKWPMSAEEQSRRWQGGRASCRRTGEKAEGLIGAFDAERNRQGSGQNIDRPTCRPRTAICKSRLSTAPSNGCWRVSVGAQATCLSFDRHRPRPSSREQRTESRGIWLSKHNRAKSRGGKGIRSQRDEIEAMIDR